MTHSVDSAAVTKLLSKIAPLREAIRTVEVKPNQESLKILAFCLNSIHRSSKKCNLSGIEEILNRQSDMLANAESAASESLNSEESEAKIKQALTGFSEQLQRLEKIVNDALPPIQSLEDTPLTLAQKNAALLKQQLITKRQEDIKLALIDDDKAIGQAVTSQLNDFGFCTKLYENLASATEAIDKETYDLIILDLVIDNSSEDEVFAFAKMCSQRQIKVVMMSSISSIDSRLKAVRANIKDYLVKPVTTSKLIAKLRKILNLNEQRPPRVLLLDDQASVITLFSAILKSHGIEVVGITDVYRLLDELETFVPDLFMLDFNMPEASGIEVATIIRQLGKYDYTPIIFLSADDSEEAKLDILKVGSEDLILKNTQPEIMVNQVMSRIIRTRSVRELAASDSLTGVLNHGQIMESAVNAFRQARRIKSNCLICMIDLDKFKSINDTYGHGVGDKVLIALGQLLLHSVRQTDFVGRYGGEEFIIVYQNSELDFVEDKVNQLRESFGNLPFNAGETTFNVTFSAGIASSKDFADINQVMAAADKALYKAKDHGRNQVVLAQK